MSRRPSRASLLRLAGAVLAVAVAAAPLSCDDTPPPAAAPGPPLDVVLPSGSARAGKVTRPSELIGGPVAYGRAGDVWKLYNARARFLVQDVGAATGLDLYGGNLIDADLVHPGDDGKNGRDLFRETFPIVGLHTVKPRAIEVVSDGTHGGPAHLRVHGDDASTDILPPLDVLAQDLGGDITIDYVLAPDVPYLAITTTYQANPKQALGQLGLGDFVSFGGSLAIASPETGFAAKPKRVSFLAGVGDGVSYGYVYPDGPLDTPIVDANGTAVLPLSPAVPTGGRVSFTRYLVVGGGDMASVSGPMYALRGIATAGLAGTVRDAGGAPVEGARVTLFAAPYDASADAVDQAKTDGAGRYRFDVPPRDYVLFVGGVGRLRVGPTSVTVAAGAGTGTAPPATRDLVAGATGAVRLDLGEIVDGVRRASPGKVSFLSLDVEIPDPRFGPDPTESERNGLHGVALSPDGQTLVPLKPGTYRAVVSRGVEYELTTVDALAVGAGAPTPLRADLRRVVDTTGFLAGDFHQHSQGSIDSGVPVVERVAENLAEGVELVASTDHDNVIDFAPAIARLAGERFLFAVAGNEVSVNGTGHFNAYPLPPDDPAHPFQRTGARYWARLPIRELAKKIHAEPTAPVLHVSHPRTKSLAGYFNSVKFDPTTGQAAGDLAVEGFDAMEVNGDLGDPEDFLPANDAAVHKAATAGAPSGVPAMRDWFAFLDLGRPMTALGNSDTHQRNGGTGYPRSFVRLQTDDPRMASGPLLADAIRRQQVIVSNGPFPTVTVNGIAGMGLGEPVSLQGATTAALGIRIQAPRWVDVSSFEVYGNGRPLALARTSAGTFVEVPGGGAGTFLATHLAPGDGGAKEGGGVVRLDGTVTVRPARDTWYVVVVRGSKSLGPVAGGTPYAYTNPVYVDVEGDGWHAPGLP